MNSIEKLAEYFKEFPGIGERQAKRFVYFLLHKNPAFVKELAETIQNVKKQVSQCPSCFVFFESTDAVKSPFCPICANDKTDRSSLLIVEKDADRESIVKSRTYSGMYFILGGLIPIVTKETPSFVRTQELLSTVEDRIARDSLKEVILALSVSTGGEYTDTHLRELLAPLQEKHGFRIVSLGRGLSTGTELEYSDPETIKNAIKNRG